MKSNPLINLIMLSGAALTLISCDSKKQPNVPAAPVFNSNQKSTFKACVYDLVKDADIYGTTSTNDHNNQFFSIDILAGGNSGSKAATITMSPDGKTATLSTTEFKLDPKKPLTQDKINAAVKGAPGCFDKALKAG